MGGTEPRAAGCAVSAGDIIGHNIGVIAQPECTHTKLDEKDMFLIIATGAVLSGLRNGAPGPVELI